MTEPTTDPALFSKMFLEAFHHIKWMAQTTHQAYHGNDNPNTYRTCEKDICASTQRVIMEWAEQHVLDEKARIAAGLKP